MNDSIDHAKLYRTLLKVEIMESEDHLNNLKNAQAALEAEENPQSGDCATYSCGCQARFEDYHPTCPEHPWAGLDFDEEGEAHFTNLEEDTEYLPTAEFKRGVPSNGHPMFYELLDRMREIHAAKAADYGDGNPLGNFINTEEDTGCPAALGVLVRMCDKWKRICNIYKNKGKHAVKDETIEDTLLDLAIYSLIDIIILRETGYLKPKPEKKRMEWAEPLDDMTYRKLRDWMCEVT
jgi:hypothetical protein